MEIKTEAKILVADRKAEPEKWSELRRDTIGSSDITTILGLNRWQTPLDLWMEMTGRKERGNVDNPATRYGKAVEPIIMELFREKHGELAVLDTEALYQHPIYEWAVCTPDAFLSYGGDEFDGLLEIKHTSMAYGWDDGGAPDYAHCQLIWQMGILGFRYGYIGAVVQGRANDLKDPMFEFDEGLFNLMLEKAANFMTLVKLDTPPTAMAADSDLVDEIYKREEGKLVDLPPEQTKQLVAKYDKASAAARRIKARLAKVEAAKKTAEVNLKVLLGNAEAGLLPDGRYAKAKYVYVQGRTQNPYSFTKFSITKKL